MTAASIEELERQIEETRRGLASTLHAIEERLSPRQQLTNAWRSAKQRTARSLWASGQWAVAHPAPAALAILGVAAALYIAKPKRRGRGR